MANERVTKAIGERFSFTIANASQDVKVIALLAAIFNTLSVTATTDPSTHVTTIVQNWASASEIVAAGYPCDAVLDDGVITTSVTCTSGNSEMSIRQFREYIKCQGKTLVDMAIQANNVDVFNTSIKVIKYSPLTGSRPDYLSLNDFYGVDQTSTSKINLRNIGLDLDFDTLMFLPVGAGRTVTITFIFQ